MQKFFNLICIFVGLLDNILVTKIDLTVIARTRLMGISNAIMRLYKFINSSKQLNTESTITSF